MQALDLSRARRRDLTGENQLAMSAFVPPKSAAEPLDHVGCDEPVSNRRAPLTVVVPTLNEDHQIVDALTDLTWADEVIVVDGGSTDATVALATASGARVLTVPNQTIAAQRNAGIAASRNRWVMALDADERVSDALRAELELLLTSTPAHAAYRIKFENHYLGRVLRHGPWGRAP